MRPFRSRILKLLIGGNYLLAINISFATCFYFQEGASTVPHIEQTPYFLETSLLYFVVAYNCIFGAVLYLIRGGIGSFRYLQNSFAYHAKLSIGGGCLLLFLSLAISPLISSTISSLFFHNYCLIRFICVFLFSSFIGFSFLKAVLCTAHKRTFNFHQLVIVGNGLQARRFVEYININKELGVNINGRVCRLEETNSYLEAWPILCDYNGFENYVRHNIVDSVAIVPSEKQTAEEISAILSVCMEQGVIIHYGDELLKTSRKRQVRTYSHKIDGQIFVTMEAGNLQGVETFIKRSLDILGSAVLLILLFPVLLFIGIAIKLNSPGPIFFQQKRVGRNKRSFLIYKLRTMHVGAEKLRKELEQQNEVSGPVFKIKNDPRITSIGFFLRKYSLDELPQLINVLCGEMSLVGPRPLPLVDFEGFENDIHRRRFSVRPGITCFWQIQGRQNVSFERWMEMDLEYIDHWSLWLDLKILFATLVSLFRRTSSGW